MRKINVKMYINAIRRQHVPLGGALRDIQKTAAKETTRFRKER